MESGSDDFILAVLVLIVLVVIIKIVSGWDCAVGGGKSSGMLDLYFQLWQQSLRLRGAPRQFRLLQ